MAWIRVSKPEKNNPFYNTKDSGGYSDCIRGWYGAKWAGRYNAAGFSVAVDSYASGYNILPNCVGLACGAFNETYVRNMKLKNPNFVEKEHFALSCHASRFISHAKSLGLTTRNPDERPPLGGIIVWAKNGSCHVAYITYVSKDGNTIKFLQSGWGGGNGDWAPPYDPVWPPREYTSHRQGRNGWANGNDNAYNCSGFIVNPAISDGEDTEVNPSPTPPNPDEPDVPIAPVIVRGGAVIGSKYAIPYVYKGGSWVKASAHIYSSGKWKETTEDK